MGISRRALLWAPLLLSACGGEPQRTDFPPLRYDYLPPLRLNVGAVDIAELPPPGPLASVSPVPAGPALRQLAEDRIAAGGSSGRAVVHIDEARITRTGGTLDGSFAVRVEILTADGTRAGFAEARVARTVNGVGSDLRGALYDMTKQMLDDMNVELEFQVRRSLRDYLQATTPTAAPATVEQQTLGAPAPPAKR